MTTRMPGRVSVTNRIDNPIVPDGRKGRLLDKSVGLATLEPEVVINFRSPDIIIAAVDTNPDLQDFADYVCDGVNDEATFDEAIMAADLFDSTDVDTFQQGARGTIRVLNGTYTWDGRLTCDTDIYGRLKIVGDGMPKIVMSYNANGADGYCPMFSVPGGGTPYNYPLIFEQIQFDGANLSNAIFISQRELTIKPLIVVRQCLFTKWDNYLWHSERGSPRMFHHNQIVDCEFAGAAFHFEGSTTGPNLIHDNSFSLCTGNMVSGNDHGFHCLISNNVQVGGGSLALNAKLGVEYADNFGF